MLPKSMFRVVSVASKATKNGKSIIKCLPVGNVQQPSCYRQITSTAFSMQAEDVAASLDKAKKEVIDELAVSPKVQKIVDAMMQLNMIEICELSKAIQVKFDIPDNIMMGAGPGTGQAAAVEEEVKEEKTAFDVKLASFDPKDKIKVIKEVRVITGLGLKEAKELVENVPSILKKDLKKDEAEAILAKLKEIGGVAELE